jgi:hypothetical protein
LVYGLTPGPSYLGPCSCCYFGWVKSYPQTGENNSFIFFNPMVKRGNKKRRMKMNKKEREIITVIQSYLLEGEGFRAKRYALDHMDYIQDSRSKDFDDAYAKLECEIDWTPNRYESDYDYNRQEEMMSDNPEIK